jgi:hypothetical protein
MMLIAQVLIIAIFTTLGTYVARKLKGKSKLEIIIPTVSALIGFFIAFSADEIGKYLAKPNIQISTKKSEKTISFDIEVDNKSINSVLVSYHIVGHITGLQYMNSLSDAFYSAQVSGEPNLPYITNKLELSLKDIIPNKKLHFVVYYTPLNTKGTISFLGSDRYEVSYKWSYKGEKFYGSQWRLVENDQITEPPPGEISVIRYSKNPNAKFNPVIPKRNFN